MLPDFQAKLEQEIATCERRMLNQLQPARMDPVALLDNHEFVRIKGIANSWREGDQTDFVQRVIDLVIGAHGYRHYLTFVLAGTPHRIDMYFSLKDAGAVKNLLYGAYPGLSLQKAAVRDLGSTLKTRFSHMGMLSGIPSRKDNRDNQPANERGEFSHLERIIRGMRDATWVYVVQAYPRPHTDVVSDRHALLERIAGIASVTRQQVQRSTQASSARTTRETETISETMAGEIVNRRAEYAVELLERELERLDAALAMGCWQVATYFGASNETACRRLAALLTGILAGPDSRPDPIRSHFCRSGTSNATSQFNTYLSSDEVALLVQLPREEVPGYAVSDLARFDVDFESSPDSSLAIGQIQWEGNNSGQAYRMKTNDLTRHGVVFGVTGSGKTTTLLNLLYQVWQAANPTPFLVIEPAKTEYRALLGRIRKGSATGPIPDLRVYTLGKDTVAPFRLNPFEFDTSDTYGSTPVLSHIDFLKVVFNAAFILYAPMPYVLETALHEIYEDKGWSLATGMNVRLTEDEWAQRHLHPIFPTLTDLYHKVEAVTARLGYEARIEQDVIAGLKARLGALRLGAKGLMLDTSRGIPISDLLSKPTVLELENIGNDDEKTFLIGLLFARLYGYRRLQAAEGKLPNGLQHVLVIEEAHRLLKHVSTSVDTESSNLRAQAIETFVNMLSEVRHYGQGVLVAEQIPSKLTPDVIKNTNLKLIHRLLAQDDRELLGSTMNMNEAQMRHLATLRPGEAVAYAEGDDHPFLLKIEDFKKMHRLHQPLDRSLSSITETCLSLGQYLPVPDFASYGLRTSKFGGPDPIIYQAALRYLSRHDSKRLWARIIARTIFARNSLPEAISHLRQQLASSPGQLSLAQYSEALIMLIVLGVAQALQERGAEKGWSYAVADSMRQSLTKGLVKFARIDDLDASALDLDRFVRAYEANMKREWGPYPGCQACRSICLYHAEVGRLLSPIDRGHVRSVLADSSFKDNQERYAQLSKVLRGIVRQWLGATGTEVQDIGYCAALAAAPALGLDEYEQAGFGQKLAGQLLR